MLMHRVIVGVLVLAMGAACSSADDGTEARAGDEPVARAVGERTYRGSFTVLESPEHGPQLCSAVADSLPPQCGGPDVVGWSWDEVEGEESSGGTTWGDYEVAGTWDGERLTLTEPPGPPNWPEQPEPDFTTPCPEPEGGWAVVDPATATQAALDAVVEQARGRDDFAGVWYDSSKAPYDEPTKLVLNIRVTGDVAAAEADLREVWGGALCVSSGERTQAELHAIQEELNDDLIGTSLFVSSGQDESAGVVRLEVMVDDGLQAELDERYGAGVVTVEARLQPEG
jgi:hypothetical protein